MMKVSVIVPVYNAEVYLKRCIDSLCNQTFLPTEYEIIAVNDGSTDESLKILLNMQQQYSNLVVLTQDNKGASAARNLGIQNATGEYIGFADADDYVESSMYKTMYEAAIQNNADIVFCNLYGNDKKMNPYMESGVYQKEEIIELIYPRLISSCDEKIQGNTLRGAVWCKMFKRSLICEHNINFNEDLIYNEDGLFGIRATLKSSIYVYMGEQYLYHNVANSGSITKRYIKDLWSRQKKMITMLEEYTKDVDYSFENQIAKKVFEIAIYSIENEIKRKNENLTSVRIKNVRMILHDEDLQRYTKKVTFKNKSRIHCAYLLAVRFKMPILALLCAKHRYRNNKYM